MLNDYGHQERLDALPDKPLAECVQDLLNDLKRRCGEFLPDEEGYGWLIATQDDMDRAYSPMTVDEAKAYMERREL